MLPFHVPHLTGREQSYVDQVFESGQFAGNGPWTNRVQAFLQSSLEAPHVLLTHSCTGALELAALLSGIGVGDEVILPSYTFCSTATAFLRTGATLVFCEVEHSTLNMDVHDALSRLTSRTRAIVPVHYAGLAPDMDALRQAAGSKGLRIVEDAAQALGVCWSGKALGTLGWAGAFSFHETKNVHCGLGGALALSCDADFERAEAIWERGTNRSKLFRGLVDKYTWVENGSSFYPTECQAAFLLAQLEAQQDIEERRRTLHDRYSLRLRPMADLGWLRTLAHDSRIRTNFHAVPVILQSASVCDALRQHLLRASIQAYIGYVPLHSSPMGLRLGYQSADLPATEDIAPRVLRLPIHTRMGVADVDIVCDSISDFFEHSAC